jgi:hypothetical protein
MPALRRDHHGRKCLDGEVGAAEIGMHLPLPVFESRFVKWLSYETDAGIVHQDVAAAKAFLDALSQTSHGFRIEKITGKAYCEAARGFDGSPDSVELGGIASRKDYSGTHG